MKPQTDDVRKQMLIFTAVAFALPFAMGILMAMGYYKGFDLTVFPTAQMYYPAAGAILAALVTRKGDPLLPKRFFGGYLVFTGLLLLCTFLSLILPKMQWGAYSQIFILFSSIVLGILLLTEKKEKRIAYGLKGKRWGAAAFIVLLYLGLYFVRTAAAYMVSGEVQTMMEILQNPFTWISLAVLPVNYFFVFTAFFGEEYGWRYYLQPILQKKIGMVPGILTLGIVWGLWHLPINFFYYTSPAEGFLSLTGQLITCTTLGVFYGWAYMKTDNIWTVVILHYVNNNLVPIISGTYTADVLQNQAVSWGSVLLLLVFNTLLFMGVLFSSYYRDKSKRLPTMDERSDRCQAD